MRFSPLVLVEVGLVSALGETVEVGEQRRLLVLGRLALARAAAQVVDQRLGVHFLLDVERRRGDHQVAPVGAVLAAPYQLRVEVGVAVLLLGLESPTAARV